MCSMYSKPQSGATVADEKIALRRRRSRESAGCSVCGSITLSAGRTDGKHLSVQITSEVGPPAENMSAPALDTSTLCLFDVDGTLTAPRQVGWTQIYHSITPSVALRCVTDENIRLHVGSADGTTGKNLMVLTVKNSLFWQGGNSGYLFLIGMQTLINVY